ncbi:hypothetical protein ACFX2C_002556 [Malus domestica]
MFRATVELDFFGMDQHHREAASYSCKSQFQKFLHRPRSFRGIRTVMSKINPEVFKSVIASGNASPNIPNPRKSFSVPSSPKVEQVLFPCLPLYVPTAISDSSIASATSESLQIFKDNLRYIDEQNSKNLSYKLSLNRFADLSNEEYRNTYLGIKTRAQKKRLSNRNTKSDQYALRVGDFGSDLEDEELERQVQEMAKKILEYRATLRNQLKNAFPSHLATPENNGEMAFKESQEKSKR